MAAQHPSIVAELVEALREANSTYYQTPLRFLTDVDCNRSEMRRVLQSGYWQPFLPSTGTKTDESTSTPAKTDVGRSTKRGFTETDGDVLIVQNHDN